MSVNIPQATLEEIVDDVLEDIEEPTAREVCNVRTPRGLSGSFGYPSLKTQAADGLYGQDVARGAEIMSEDVNVDSQSYDARKQAGSAWVTVEDQIDADEYNVDAIEMAAESAIEDSMAAVESKFDSFLTGSQMTDDSSKKRAAWDDGGSTSKPYLTMSEMARDALASDLTAVVGGKTLEELRSHPDTKEQDANYSGSGQVEDDIVLEKIRQAHRNITNVVLFEDLYDTAAAGLTESLSYFFNKSIWIGSSDMTFMVDPQHPRNPVQETETRASRLGSQIVYAQFIDFQAPISKLGRYISDVTA